MMRSKGRRKRKSTARGAAVRLLLPLSRATLESHPRAERVPSAVRESVEQLVVIPAVRAQRFVREVERLEVHVEFLGDLITRRQVDLQARIDEGRFGPERGIVLVLA